MYTPARTNAQRLELGIRRKISYNVFVLINLIHHFGNGYLHNGVGFLRYKTGELTHAAVQSKPSPPVSLLRAFRKIRQSAPHGPWCLCGHRGAVFLDQLRLCMTGSFKPGRSGVIIMLIGRPISRMVISPTYFSFSLMKKESLGIGKSMCAWLLPLSRNGE